MHPIVLESVTKIFRNRPALFGWLGREQRGETRALERVSLRVDAGQVLVLLGPNGSGKTTLLKLISTMLLPDAGRVLISGQDTLRNSDAVRRIVGFAVASERSFFPRLTACENLDFFGALDDLRKQQRRQRIGWLLRATGLEEAAHLPVMKFSAGMYQRLAIARAMLKDPSVLLLDEPTRSLDVAVTARIGELVRQTAASGTTVVMATHNLQEAVAVGDSVALLSRGSLLTHEKISARTSARELLALYLAETGEAAAPTRAGGGA